MGVLAVDSFDRANVNPIGGVWTTATGNSGLAIASNAITFGSLNNDCAAFYNAVTWPADQYSQLNCTVGTAGGGLGIGPAVRQASGALTRYRLVVSRSAANNFELSKEVAAAWTLIWDRTSTFTNGNPARLEAQGTTLRAYNNGVQVGADTTDSSIATGNAGIVYSGADAAAVGDNWEGGDFLDPGGTTQGGACTGIGIQRPVARGWM